MKVKPLKIIQVIQSMGKGGAERYAADVSIALKKAGHTVKLISFEDTNAYPFLTNQIDFEVIKTYVHPSISSKHEFYTDAFDKLVQNFKPDIIHSHLFKAEMASRNFINPSSTYITSCQNNMPEFANWSPKSALKKITYTRLYEKIWMIKKYRECENNFIAISKNTFSYYKNSLPVDLSMNIELIYHAINFDKFHAANRYRIDSLHQVNLVYVARYVPIKNHIFLIDVVSEIKNKNIPVTLTLLGEGAEMNKVKQRAQELEVEQEIRFMGNVDNVEDYLAEANVYVHPATYEPFGLVIIEAMAAGLPAVCLDGKGNRDLIENGKNGFMLFDSEPAKFADKIIEITRDKKTYCALAKGAVEYAKLYDMPNHVETIVDFYHNSMQKRNAFASK